MKLAAGEARKAATPPISSGNPTFDHALVDAIKRVRAFPPPPPHLAKMARDGVVLEFQP